MQKHHLDTLESAGEVLNKASAQLATTGSAQSIKIPHHIPRDPTTHTGLAQTATLERATITAKSTPVKYSAKATLPDKTPTVHHFGKTPPTPAKVSKKSSTISTKSSHPSTTPAPAAKSPSNPIKTSAAAKPHSSSAKAPIPSTSTSTSASPTTPASSPATPPPSTQPKTPPSATPSDAELLSTLQQKAAKVKATHAAPVTSTTPPPPNPSLLQKPRSFLAKLTGKNPASAYTTTSFADLPEDSEQFLADPPVSVAELGTRRSASERMIEREMERQHDLELEPRRRLRRILIGTCAGLVVIGGIVGMISTMITVNANKINYRDTYKSAKELKTPIIMIRNNYACNDVISYAENVYTTQKDYAGYADECISIGDEATEAIDEFITTEGYLKDPEIQEQFNTFKESFDQTVLTGKDFEKTVTMYQLWHKWLLAERDLDGWDQTEADLKKAAKILLDSGNQTFAQYAEGWLRHRLAAAKAYREYYDASYLDENRTELREAMETSQQSHNEWDAANKPNILTEFPLEVSGTAKLYTKFNHLYNLVKDRYQENYVSGSGDCAESISQIVCD